MNGDLMLVFSELIIVPIYENKCPKMNTGFLLYLGFSALHKTCSFLRFGTLSHIYSVAMQGFP